MIAFSTSTGLALPISEIATHRMADGPSKFDTLADEEHGFSPKRLLQRYPKLSSDERQRLVDWARTVSFAGNLEIFADAALTEKLKSLYDNEPELRSDRRYWKSFFVFLVIFAMSVPVALLMSAW